MANRDRLTALDTTFLHLERSGAHMHVAGILVFDGDPPAYDDLVEAIEARMHLVPRYRQKLAHVPYGQGRPVWVDDPHFNARYHLRHSALPSPGSLARRRSRTRRWRARWRRSGSTPTSPTRRGPRTDASDAHRVPPAEPRRRDRGG